MEERESLRKSEELIEVCLLSVIGATFNLKHFITILNIFGGILTYAGLAEDLEIKLLQYWRI